MDNRLNHSLAKVVQFIDERIESLEKESDSTDGEREQTMIWTFLVVKEFIYSMAALEPKKD